MNKKRLQIEQLENKLSGFNAAQKVVAPPTGWLKAVRVSLGMSLQQLADKLSITKQSVQEIELREKEGTITLKSLRETANALDMQLVYGLVPKDGSIEKLVDRKAKELATRIVSRTSNTMKLEDQENTQQRLKKAIEERTAIIKDGYYFYGYENSAYDYDKFDSLPEKQLADYINHLIEINPEGEP